MLKIKLKSLAAEAKIIRKEERRCPAWQSELWHHRISIVRRVARETHLAYAAIRGRSSPEREGSRPYDAKAVNSMILKYGSKEQRDLMSRQLQQKAA